MTDTGYTKIKNKYQVMSIVLLLVCLSLFGALIYCQSKIVKLEAELNSALEDKEIMKISNIDLIDKLTKEKAEIERLESGDITFVDISELKAKGLNDVPKDIQEDLKKRTDFIPISATLGGTMQFHPIYVLSDKWVFALFGDGHNGGSMLLEYQVENGNISWNILRIYLN